MEQENEHKPDQPEPEQKADGGAPAAQPAQGKPPEPGKADKPEESPPGRDQSADVKIDHLNSFNVHDKVDKVVGTQTIHGYGVDDVIKINEYLVGVISAERRTEHYSQQHGRTIRRQIILVEETAQAPQPKDPQEYAKQFDQLSNTDKLFVVLLRLFPDITWVDFWEIYDLTAQEIFPAKKKTKAKSGDAPDARKDEEGTSPRFRSEEYWVKVVHAEISLTTTTYVEGKETKTTMNFAARKPAEEGNGAGAALESIRAIVETYLSTYQRNWLFRIAPTLHALGRHPSLPIRQIVAQATTVLAMIDFDHICRTIYDPWSNDEMETTRDMVGYAFDSIIGEGSNNAAAVALLRRWSNPQNQFMWRQCWTAAASHKWIGQHRFDLAKKDLKDLNSIADKILAKYEPGQFITVVDIELLSKLPDSIVHTLVVLSIMGKVKEVLNLFEEWLEDNKKGPKYNFEHFTIIRSLEAISSVTLDLKKQNIPMESDFFELIKDKDFRMCLANILAFATKMSVEMRKYVTETLRKWVVQLGELRLDTEPVGRIIVNMFRRFDAYYRDRVLRFLKVWMKSDNNTVRYLANDVYYKLINANYPLPEDNPPPESNPKHERIVFG